jgi:hypothetical protein
MKVPQWKFGNEFAPYHPQASHCNPDYRDGWNHCYRAAEAAIKDRDAEIERLKKDAGRLDHLQRRGATVEILPAGLSWKFRVGGSHSGASHNIRAAIDAAIDAMGKDGAHD